MFSRHAYSIKYSRSSDIVMVRYNEMKNKIDNNVALTVLQYEVVFSIGVQYERLAHDKRHQRCSMYATGVG